MARVRVGLWCASLVVALGALHLIPAPEFVVPLGPGEWRSWVNEVGPAVAIVGVIRLVAIALAWYLVLATVLGGGARLLGRRRVVAMADTVTPRFVRRLLASAGGLAVATAGLAVASAPFALGIDRPAGAREQVDDGPALAALGRLTPVEVRVGSQGSGSPGPPPSRPGGADGGRDARGDGPGESDAEPPAEASTASFRVLDLADLGALLTGAEQPAPKVDDRWEVGCGDHFWLIAEEILEDALGEVPDDDQVAVYWRRLIEANLDRLVAPDNPDLLVPGQVLTIPTPGVGGE